MAKKLLIPLGILLLFLLVFSFSFFSSVKNFNPIGINKAKNVPTKTPQVPEPINPQITQTAQITPADKDTAIPITSVPVLTDAPNNIRSFNISLKDNIFSSQKIIVNQGDVVSINFAALDKASDMSFPDFGVSQQVPSGEIKILEFQATSEGTFPYICNTCDDPKPRGEFVVVKRS
jgi:heme/copper-type cytochrome/quinol oxidase subunit 2